MKMYRLRSVKPKHDLFLMAENEDTLSFLLYPYIINKGIRRMYAYKEHELKGVELGELPEGVYIITEYEPGEVVEATSPSPMTPTKEEQLAAYANYLIDKFKIYNIGFRDFEAWKKRQYPTLPSPTTKTKTMKTPDQILKEHEDANEMHFHQVDREWIVKAMEEYASLKCDHPGGLVVTSETGQTIHKCLDCGNERPVHDYTDKPSILPLSSLIEQWAEEKGILSKATPIKQAMKTQEEVNELCNAILDDNRDEIKDAIGDIMVTLIIQCKMQGMDLQDCLESAYNVIKNRTGKMVDGVFVKD